MLKSFFTKKSIHLILKPLNNFKRNIPTGTSTNRSNSRKFTYKLHKLLRVKGVEVYTFHDPGIIKEDSGIKLLYSM